MAGPGKQKTEDCQLDCFSVAGETYLDIAFLLPLGKVTKSIQISRLCHPLNSLKHLLCHYFKMLDNINALKNIAINVWVSVAKS